MDFYQEVVVVTRYKEICQSHIIEVMKSLPPETEYLVELLNEVGLLPRFECFQLLNGWRYIDFQTGHFPALSSFVILQTWNISQLIVNFLTLCMSQLTDLYYFEQAMAVLLGMGKTSGHTKQSEGSLFDNKFKNHTQICQKFSLIQSELISPVYKQTLKVESFISFCNTFSDLCHKIKYV